MTTYKGHMTAPKDGRFAIVVGRFNEFVTGKLLAGAQDVLHRHEVPEDNIDIIWTPGSFEIPLVAGRAAASGQYAAVICLGAVIRGGTDHYEYVCREVAKGVSQVMHDTGVPCIFGILTCDSVEQAVDRAGTKSGNKGADAALSALEMANLLSTLPGAP